MTNSVNVEKEPKKRGTKIAKKGPNHNKGKGKGERKYAEQSTKDPAAERILNAAQWN